MHRKAVVVLVGAVLGASSLATAQRWGRESRPRDGVCFYENPDFRGDYFCLRAGEDLKSMPSEMNDRISSLRIYGRAEVEVYKDGSFKGKSARFDGDVRDLKLNIWNDRISSVRVRSGPGYGNTASYGSGSVIRERAPQDADQIVRRAYRDLLDREPDSSGLRLYRNHILEDDWSEAQVREAIRSSGEYKQKTTMTHARAEEIVRAAYHSVLGRDPDAGSSGYVNRVMREGWTRQDVERELRKSAEYRNRR